MPDNMQPMCRGDKSGRGEHCYCKEVDLQRGVRKCCRCGMWNVHGRDWTSTEDYR